MLNLKSLNKNQREAVEYVQGPALVVAGAGSGKTKVLTYKIAHLIENNFSPENILALTFTNKAAKEMKERIHGLIGESAQHLWMGTFHSIFARILRTEAASIGYTSNFSIYDTEDTHSAVSNIIEDLQLNSDVIVASKVRRRISYLKNLMIFPDEFKKDHIKNPTDEYIARIYEVYQQRLIENNAMDFEDLILKPLELFQNDKILKKYKKKFLYILVDEFQDTNKAQYEILKRLCSKEGHITVVGDDSQSIYSWRGAEIGNILSFESDFTKAKVFKLEQNYRSTQMILQAADSVIKKNSRQIEKTLWTENPIGEQLSLLKSSDEKEEAIRIAKLIKEEITRHKYAHSDFAILYRTNAQSRTFEDVFRRERIPYVIIGGIEFYKRKEVKDLIGYLKVLTNPRDEESLLRIMNFPQRGIGMTTIKRMIGFARKHEITLFETMTRVFEVIDIKERIQKNVKNFKGLLDKYIVLREKLSPGELTRALIDELGIVQMFKEDATHESMERLRNVEELLSAITEYSSANPESTLDDYLQEVALVTDLEMVDDKQNVVSLLTVHSAKGLEFPLVFVSGLEEDIFPLSNRFSSEATEEEERRLFYVAITRAQKKVYLSHARSRYRFGEVAYQNRSKFIDEVNPATINFDDPLANKRLERKSKKELMEETFATMDYIDPVIINSMIKIGSKVYHDTFKMGKVTQIIGTGDNQKVTVQFDGNNIKHLMLKYAKLKVLH
ncbi:MAG: UvrD-helicase domain-containing protein [Ignavibacteriales bacterium]|nr:ATP-dependent DNA helicase PcrA [Ignavibacteriaceae bacterium]MCK6615635.1 UvrD-helicase domain-containing protein [Ignavibacteriaceae bacterium]QOJ29147.1 MAG: UvrD-helicase domain-containing protein [Ignavibacteriales bacterium]